MLRAHYVLFKRLMIFFDLCIVVGSFFLGYFLNNESYDIYHINSYLRLLLKLLIIWGVLLYYFGMYDSFRIKQIPDILSILFKTALVGSILFASFIFLTKMHSVSRALVIYTSLFAVIFIGIEKITLIYYFRYQRKKGLNYRNILIVGTGKRAQRFIDIANKHTEWGFKIVGLVDEDATKINNLIHGYKVIGSFKDVSKIIHSNVVDEVVFIVPRSWLGKIEEIMYVCEVEGLKVSVAVDLYELKLSKAKYSHFEEFPLLTFESTPDKLLHLLIKRLFDIVFSGITLLILSPIFATTAIIIKLSSKGPVFFKQQRCSLYGRRFMLYKFRTMVQNAEAKLNDLLIYNEMDGPVFKMKDDPRVTKIGKFLRKFSIDELPQFWNVLTGDMSLVGPRPPLPTEVDKYKPWQRRRLSMRPGITCQWQAYGRSNIKDFNEWMKLDLEYIDSWSLLLDCKILFKTVPVVLFGIGAK